MKPKSVTATKLYIGFDVHKEKTAIALAEPGAGGEIRSYGEVATTQIALERTIRNAKGLPPATAGHPSAWGVRTALSREARLRAW